jgi:hypothetical protein
MRTLAGHLGLVSLGSIDVLDPLISLRLSAGFLFAVRMQWDGEHGDALPWIASGCSRQFSSERMRNVMAPSTPEPMPWLVVPGRD